MAASDIVYTNPMARLTNAGGDVKLSSGSFTGKYLFYIQANEDTAISALDGFDQGGFPINWLTELGCATMKAGQRIVLKDHCYIKTGTITSGSLTAGKIKE